MHVPETGKGRWSGKIGEHAMGRKWKSVVSELGSQICGECLDEIGENYENRRRRWCRTRPTRQSKPEEDRNGSEPEDEDWEEADEVRKGSVCYNCG